MKTVQTPHFRRSYKKLHANQFKSVNEAIRHILSDISCGEEKRGDLAGVRIYKFRVLEQQFLPAYEFDNETLFLLALGVHENFYRDLKKSKVK
jgi:mRNA interferase RelE/StbE